jgi:hypothetical protein
MSVDYSNIEDIKAIITLIIMAGSTGIPYKKEYDS